MKNRIVLRTIGRRTYGVRFEAGVKGDRLWWTWSANKASRIYHWFSIGTETRKGIGKVWAIVFLFWKLSFIVSVPHTLKGQCPLSSIPTDESPP